MKTNETDIREDLPRLSDIALRGLCIRENWFTGGTVDQYGKLFDLNQAGAPDSELALVIWVCSPKADRDMITQTLKTAREHAKAWLS